MGLVLGFSYAYAVLRAPTATPVTPGIPTPWVPGEPVVTMHVPPEPVSLRRCYPVLSLQPDGKMVTECVPSPLFAPKLLDKGHRDKNRSADEIIK